MMRTQTAILTQSLRNLVALLALTFGLHTVCGQLSFVPGNYYSASFWSRTITQYNPSGQVVGSFTLPSSLADEVRGLAFGPDGLLYASAVWGSGFKVLAYDASGTLRQTYTGSVYLAGNLGYGKLAVDNQHIYVAGQDQLIRFDIGNPNSGVSLYSNNQVFDVDLMPNGNLLVLSAYYLDEITPSGSLVRRLPAWLTDARGVEYEPASDKVFVTQLGHTGFFFQLMRFNWTTGAMEANTYFWYGEDIFLTDSGRLLVGSSTTTPAFFTQDLTQVGTLGGGAQMFVTEFVPQQAATNAPPTLTCPAAAVVECGTEAELTAQVSDPEGDAMAVVWTLNGTAIQTNLVPASSPDTVSNLSISGSFPLGTNMLGIAVTDGTNVTSCTSSVTVIDTTSPVISDVTASSTVLWPPDHRMVRVALRGSVSDVCGAATWSIIGVQCNEPTNALGDGNTPADWSIAGEDTVFLRAERSGRGDSRIYSIQVQATDASGNHSEIQTVTVTVPKNLGKGR